MGSPTQNRGKLIEQLSLEFLRSKGLTLITQNYRCRLGEIDLIMLDLSAIQGNILVMVEVRYRHSTQFGGSAASVNKTKQQRIIGAAKHFSKCQPRYQHLPARFDVVAVSGHTQSADFRWIKSAFTLT